ncbi:hypothetical protein GLU60_00895 [Nanohaloarchaea archaeon H01]|nr:hypothetical protein [Nanohaloarchaea archaeon H01]
MSFIHNEIIDKLDLDPVNSSYGRKVEFENETHRRLESEFGFVEVYADNSSWLDRILTPGSGGEYVAKVEEDITSEPAFYFVVNQDELDSLMQAVDSLEANVSEGYL